MTGTATRCLSLARHGEAAPDESGPTDAGRRQATGLGRRLSDVPLTAVHHGPLPRAAETARLVADELAGVTVRVSETAGDYVPHVPEPDELPAESADFYLDFLAGATDGEREHGAVARPQPRQRGAQRRRLRARPSRLRPPVRRHAAPARRAALDGLPSEPHV